MNLPAIRQDNLPELMSRLRQLLEDAQTIQQTIKVRHAAKAVEEFLFAQGSRKTAKGAAEIRLRAERKAGGMLKDPEKLPRRQKGGDQKSTDILSVDRLDDLGVHYQQAYRWQRIASVPEEFFEEYIHEREAREFDELTTSGLLKLAAREQQQEDREERRATRKDAALPENCTLIHADLSAAAIPAASVDVIITDPPYPKEFLPVYGQLALLAARVLKPGGSLLVMTGHIWLPAVLRALETDELRYHWTVAYLTPGGQSTQIWPRKVNTFWKPVLWFVNGEYSGDWVGDVVRSDVNDNDKRFHEWGQSESGMAELVARFSQPGETILDPFLGGGTTGAVALKMGRRFIGIDADGDAIETTKARLSA